MSNVVLKALIVDDEKLARRDLKYLLASVKGVEVVGEAANGIEALKMIEKTEPDIVFLDIEMPGLNGLEVVERLMPKGLKVDVIFVTAYDHYAVKAFDVNAIDYLLKPVAPERLAEAVDRARTRVSSGAPPSVPIDTIIASVTNRKNKKLTIRSGESMRIIDEDELIYASIEGGVVTAITHELEGTMSYQSLDELQGVLSDNFVRAHRAFVVNVDMITEVIPWFSGTFRLRMKNNSEIPLSRKQAKELRKLLDF